jgi:hypothetical protein
MQRSGGQLGMFTVAVDGNEQCGTDGGIWLVELGTDGCDAQTGHLCG